MIENLIVAGFQRSGHNFLMHHLKNRYFLNHIENKNYALHSVVHHKNYISGGLSHPFIVPLRDPVDTLISHHVHAKKLSDNFSASQEVKGKINELSELWNFVYNHENFFVAVFEEFTQDVDTFFTKLETFYPELANNKREKTMPNDEVYRNFELGEISTIDPSMYLEVGHVPRKKSPFYDEVAEVLYGYSNSMEMLQIKDLYEKLKDRY
jgi:hypothetical protein